MDTFAYLEVPSDLVDTLRKLFVMLGFQEDKRLRMHGSGKTSYFLVAGLTTVQLLSIPFTQAFLRRGPKEATQVLEIPVADLTEVSVQILEWGRYSFGARLVLEYIDDDVVEIDLVDILRLKLRLVKGKADG